MALERLIEELRRPSAYPHPVEGEVEVRHTHISVVFLAGEYAYKVKKPLDLGFLDFTSFERRLHFCREEVRLNRRLAHDVYLGVSPLTRTGEGGLEVDGRGEVEEHAVRMVRLPPEATLRARLDREELEPEVLDRVARRIADFHASAASSPEISAFGRWEVVAGNARDNLTQAEGQVGVTLSAAVRGRLGRALERRLDEARSLIEERARRHRPRDTHGDLHLDHVYFFPERPAGQTLSIIDCIEFNERFRYADPISDAAFLAMDLARRGRRDLEARFSRSYLEAAGDEEGAALLPLYRSYRAAVRGKVEGLPRGEEVPDEERERARAGARGHWLLALSELESAQERPGLVLVGGLPGTGKSTLAEELARREGFRLLSSDRTRKELAGVAGGERTAASFEDGIYTPAWTDRTYEACLELARDALFQGERVAVDATFRSEEHRRRFLEAARDDGVRALFLVCRAPDEVVRRRLARPRSGLSDADWEVHRRAALEWEEPSGATLALTGEVDTAGSVERAADQARRHLERAGLSEGAR